MTDSHNVEAVEELFYSQLVSDKPQIKIAMLLVSAFSDEEFPPDEIINMALNKLVLRHDIQSFGQIHKWRHSEIKRHSKTAF